jgi:hypothetical protein
MSKLASDASISLSRFFLSHLVLIANEEQAAQNIRGAPTDIWMIVDQQGRNEIRDSFFNSRDEPLAIQLQSLVGNTAKLSEELEMLIPCAVIDRLHPLCDKVDQASDRILIGRMLAEDDGAFKEWNAKFRGRIPQTNLQGLQDMWQKADLWLSLEKGSHYHLRNLRLDANLIMLQQLHQKQ